MPPIRELLDDDDALRLAVRQHPPSRLAHLVNQIDDGYRLDELRKLIRRIYRLYIEEWGDAYAQEFMQRLR